MVFLVLNLVRFLQVGVISGFIAGVIAEVIAGVFAGWGGGKSVGTWPG